MNQLPSEMNLRYFLFFLCVHAFAAQAQLAAIQSSECGGTYLAEPHFLKKETIGDTTYISLSASNNCFGYHNPTVHLSGDSVFIAIHPGTKRVTYNIKNKRKYRIINESELEKSGLTNYRDSLHLKQESVLTAECDCCFTFDLKIVGVDASKPYKYFYNNTFVDPDYVRKEREDIQLR